MSQVQSSTPVCPKCRKTMKLMLARGQDERILRCADCGQPDPMHDAETSRWLNGDLGGRE
jgi:tRNA(Ile2) C34 agmatinyltransferase TiaS